MIGYFTLPAMRWIWIWVSGIIASLISCLSCKENSRTQLHFSCWQKHLLQFHPRNVFCNAFLSPLFRCFSQSNRNTFQSNPGPLSLCFGWHLWRKNSSISWTPHKRLRGPHLFLCKTKSNHVHWFFTSCRMNSLCAFQDLVCYNANLPSACFVVCEVPSLQWSPKSSTRPCATASTCSCARSEWIYDWLLTRLPCLEFPSLPWHFRISSQGSRNVKVPLWDECCHYCMALRHGLFLLMLVEGEHWRAHSKQIFKYKSGAWVQAKNRKNSNVLRHLGCECLNLSQKTIGHPLKTRLYVLNCMLNQKLQINCPILITLHSIDAEKEKPFKFLMHCLTSQVFMKK